MVARSSLLSIGHRPSLPSRRRSWLRRRCGPRFPTMRVLVLKVGLPPALAGGSCCEKRRGKEPRASPESEWRRANYLLRCGNPTRWRNAAEHHSQTSPNVPLANAPWLTATDQTLGAIAGKLNRASIRLRWSSQKLNWINIKRVREFSDNFEARICHASL